MIKKYNKFNEGIDQYLKGPTEEEALNAYMVMEPNKMLIKTVKQSFLPGVKVALERGADINTVDDKHNALDYAIYNKNSEIIDYLLDNGISIINEFHILSKVISENNYNLIKRLIEYGININAPIPYTGSMSMLSIAIRYKNRGIIKLLIENGVDVTHNRNAALKHLIYNCDTELIKLLLEKGANPKVYINMEKKFDKKVSYEDIINTLKLLIK